MSEALFVRRALAQSGLVPVDAQVLLSHVTGRHRAWLAAHADDPLTPQQTDAFFSLAKRRRGGEPVAYLTGVREFWGLALCVSPAVLIPRAETEAVVELALMHLARNRDCRVLDLGTGSGAVALAIGHERRHVNVLGLDISEAALAVARDNGERLGIRNVSWLCSDWYGALPTPASAAMFDAIVSNPPYVEAGDAHLEQGDLRFEPATALVSGDDGLAAIRRIVAGAPERLATGGLLAIEHGYDQSERVQTLLRDTGFSDVGSVRDLAGIPRVTHGMWPGES